MSDTPDNLAIWNALAKTDPAHTKQFSRAGGFRGTAIKPMWIVKMLTDQFGACGTGWGIDKPEFQVVQGEGETLVFCAVRCWYASGPDRFHQELHGVGGDRIVTRRRDGAAFNDDEAFKKAYTDAIGNAFKFLGVGADVHMGLFDDSKYVEATQAEFRQQDKDSELLREPEARAKLEGTHTSKTALRNAVNALIAKVRECNTGQEITAFLKAEKDTVDQAVRDWPALIEGDPRIEEDGGLRGAVAQQRAAVSEDTPTSALIREMRQNQTALALSRWMGASSERVEALNGADARRFQAAYDAHEAGLTAVAQLSAG